MIATNTSRRPWWGVLLLGGLSLCYLADAKIFLHQYKGISPVTSNSLLVYAKGKWGLQDGDHVCLKGCRGLLWQVVALKNAVQCTDMRVATLRTIDGSDHELGELAQWEAKDQKSLLLVGTREKATTDLKAGARKWFGDNWFEG
jgi:hypothetical protein